jgi:hypothetical protein
MLVEFPGTQVKRLLAKGQMPQGLPYTGNTGATQRIQAKVLRMHMMQSSSVCKEMELPVQKNAANRSWRR